MENEDKFQEYLSTQAGMIDDLLAAAKKGLKLREWDDVIAKLNEAVHRIIRLYIELLEGENPAFEEMSVGELIASFELPVPDQMLEFVSLVSQSDLEQIKRQRHLYDFVRQLSGEELYEEESELNKVPWDRLAYSYYKVAQDLKEKLLGEIIGLD